MSSKFTRDDKEKLARKRAVNPAISAAAAGTSAAALGANVGGIGLRRMAQKQS